MANILSFVSGFSYLQMFCLFQVPSSGRQAGSIKQVYRVPDYLAKKFLSILICKCSVCFIWHKAGIRQVYRGQRLSGKKISGNYLAILICKCSVCTMLASGRCTEGSDYLAIRHTSPHSPPLSMSKYPFNHILHTIINYSKTMWVQNITAAIMMFGGNLQHPDVQNTTFAIQLLFSDQT